MRALLALLLACVLIPMSTMAGDSSPARPGTPRYTFAWPLDAPMPKPRGGVTKGAPVELDTTPSEAWRALRAENLTDFERDRRAILAMAGTYRVTFDFLEIVSYAQPDALVAPYQSWATEKIYVDEDTGRSISLVHILEMRTVEPDGSIGETLVTKHWRQDWTYEPPHIVEYVGRDRWVRRTLAPDDVKGQWLQTVYQVDESPRYASIGRWEHNASFSSWSSGETWRPLPRREWSVRDDYDVLIGTNRHTIYPTGWLQEENNLKAVLGEDGTPAHTQPYLAREYGIARYERIRGADFAAADRYYASTRVFWNAVRARWSEIFATQGMAQLRGPVDKLGLFQPLFAHAEAILEQGAEASAKTPAVIESALRDMGVVDPR
ncbi:MAG: hypothetical protein C0P74_010905 [Gammaproteobacteria bacterium]